MIPPVNQSFTTDFERAAARHAALAHAASDHRRVTRHAATRGQHAEGGQDAGQLEREHTPGFVRMVVVPG